ncbi:MAG: BamA/TamA family outer membrane protein [Deltaproteobacteria bacterium]|nr:BamA/TamA family outer membrane protein [Deltaproteobacteria bacterium]
MAVLGSVVVEGSIDPPGRIEALIETVAPAGQPFVPSGEADRVGMPIGTIPRIKHVLAVIGYAAEIGEAASGGSVQLRVRLRPMNRVRRIFVSGNQPFLRQGMRQETIIGKLSIRPGMKLPSAGPERDAFIAAEVDHVRDFLRSSGYWEAEVRIELHDHGKEPAGYDLLVRVRLGPAYPLGPLQIVGATALAPNDIEEGFRHGDWHTLWLLPKPFQRADLREDIANLVMRYRRIGFPGVRVQDDFDEERSLDRQAKNVRLGIEIRERRHVEVAFEGNRTRSAASLHNHLTFLAHGAYDDVEAATSAAALEHAYHERGHMLVKVKWRRQRISEHSDRVIFTIDEGPLLKVRGISFEGNHAFSSDALAEGIRTKVFPFLGVIGLGEGGFASLRQLQLDVESLVEHYAAQGYPETKVRAEIAPHPGEWRPLPASIEKAEEPVWRNADSLYVRFIIEESQLLWVAGMQFTCLGPGEGLPREDEFYMESLRTTLGAPYQPTFIRRDENRIKRALGDDGYRYAQVEAKSVRHGNQMHITWQVKTGPQVRIGPVFLRGNFLTTGRTIMTWAELRSGDILTTRGLERAQRNLALIQLFNNPNPIAFPSIGPEDPLVPMVIEVEERHDHWGVIKVGGGASTDQAPPDSSFPHLGVYGAAGYEHRNLFGHGWTFLTSLAYGSTLQNYTASFLNPRFFGSLFRMEIVGSYLQQATLRLGDIHSGSGSFGFSREMYPGVDAGLRYNLRNTSRTEMLDRGATPGPFQGPEQNTVRIGTFVSSLSATVEWRRLDHVLVPTRGFKIAAGVEVALRALAFNVGDDSFVKFYGRGLSVVPLLPWLSLRYSIRYDQGFPLGGAALLPKVERYFAGGDTTIRGYQLDHALTETISRPATPGMSYVGYRPMGGNLRILQNIDLQFPIAAPLYGSVFLDSGTVGYSLGGISARDFRHGVGFSPLLIKLPVGDLSLSFAIPLNRRPGDDRWRTHFNVGLMF